ncbi:MAG: hypothetical protein BGO07_04715 [Alphaproteobacteria bacterium 40-19]|nr:MAG: hypothetical protein BGO07_04715 [Alphaproteobacteria bacterium 40-19]
MQNVTLMKKKNTLFLMMLAALATDISADVQTEKKPPLVEKSSDKESFAKSSAQIDPHYLSKTAETCVLSVVNISAASLPPKHKGQEHELGPLPEGPLGELLKRYFAEKLQPRKVTSLGSGFVIHCKESGKNQYRILIVTNYHVIAHIVENYDRFYAPTLESKGDQRRKTPTSKGGKVTIKTDGGKEFTASIFGTDPLCDLALLEVSSSEPLPVLEWGDYSKVRLADPVLAIGNPFGLGGTVSFGIISRKDRNMPSEPGEASQVGQWLQTDVAVNPGNSGGPLLDRDGRVVAVSTAILSIGGGSLGITFGIPCETAQYVCEELIKNGGYVKRGVIGVILGEPVDDAMAAALNMEKTQGVMVGSVMPGKPAEEAGIKSGDVILEINDRKMMSAYDARRAISRMKAGSSIRMRLWRSQGQKMLNVTVKVEELNPDALIAESKPGTCHELGFTVEANEKGTVVVTEVDEEGPASDKLRPGDIIVEIGSYSITSLEQALSIIREAKKTGKSNLLLVIVRSGEKRHLALSLK